MQGGIWKDQPSFGTISIKLLIYRISQVNGVPFVAVLRREDGAVSSFS